MRFAAAMLLVACTPAPVDSGGGGGTVGAGGGMSASGGGTDNGAGGGTASAGGGMSANGGGTATGGSSATGGGSAAGGGSGIGANDAGITCDGGETFTVVDPLMLGGCTGFGPFSCHGRSPFEASLDLTAGHHYSSLVNVASTTTPSKLRVKPGDPLGSFLVQKLTNTQGPNEGGPMPQGVEGLMWRPPDPENLRLLECWIAQGAQDN